MGSNPSDVRTLLGPFAFPLPAETHTCGYLKDREATDEAYAVLQLAPLSYHALMNRNFRRAGQVLYRPRCATCTLCRQIRVPVRDFEPSRSQRRCLAQNSDIKRRMREPHLDREKHELYSRYLRVRHPGSPQSADLVAMRSFLYSSCVATLELEYRDGNGRLLGVSVVDACSESLSSVYHYFDPDEDKRGLGTFMILAAIELAKGRGIPWYYLGYWVKGCESMDYKTRFLPHEVLEPDGQWLRVERSRNA